MSVTTGQVTTLLENVLFESPTLAAANTATWLANSAAIPGADTVAGLAATMAASDEAQISQQVVRYYLGSLGRAPSGSEIAYYVNAAEQGLSASDIAKGSSGVPSSVWTTLATYFSASPEFSQDFGLGVHGALDPANEGIVITAFYTNILGRAPNTSEIAFYENALANGTTVPELLLFFTISSEYQSQVDSSLATALAANGTSVVNGITPVTIPFSLPGQIITETLTSSALTVSGTSKSTTVTVTGTPAQAAQSAVTAVTGVIPVTVVPAATGVQGVAAVIGVTPQTGQTAQSAVTDGAVTINDANSSSTGAGAITTVTLANSGAGSVIKDNGLTSLSLTGTTGTLAITNSNSAAIAAHASVLSLTLDGLNVSANSITDTNSEIATLNVITANNDSILTGFVDSALSILTVSGTNMLTLKSINSSLTSLTVSGAAGFSDGAGVHGTGLAARGSQLAITDTSTGSFTAVLDDTAMNFTGGAGTDTITVSALADATHTITAGSATNNEIIFEGGAYGLTSASSGKFVNFRIVGVAGNVTGAIDLSVVAANVSTLEMLGASSVSFTKAATGAALLFDRSVTGASVSVSYADSSGASDSTAITMSSTVSSLSLQDSAGIGIATLNVTDNLAATETNVSAAHTLSALTDNGLSTLNVSGNAGLIIGSLTETTTPATSFTVNNASTNGYGVTINSLTDTALTSLAFAGSGVSTIGSLTTGAGSLTITNSGTVLDFVGTITDNSLGSLTLANNVAIGQVSTPLTTNGLQDGSSSGVIVAGAADNAHVTVNLTSGAALGKTDSITLGNGSNIVVDASTAGTVTVNLGSGANLVELGSAALDTTALYNVTLAARTAAAPNIIFVGTAGNNYASAPNTVITGLSVGDIIAFGNDPVSSSSAPSIIALAGAANVAAVVALLEAADKTAHKVVVGSYLGNTYLAESVTGFGGNLDTTVIELVGTPTLTASTGYLTVGTTASILTTGALSGAGFTIPADSVTNLTLKAGSNTVNMIGTATNISDTFTSILGSTALILNYQAAGSTDTVQMSGTGGVNTSDVTSMVINDTSSASAGITIGAFTDNNLTSVTYTNSAAAGATMTQSALTSSSLTNINFSGGIAGQATNVYFLTAALSTSGTVTISDTNVGTGVTTMGLTLTNGPSALILNMSGPGTLATGTLADDNLLALTIGGTGAGSVNVGRLTDAVTGGFTVTDTRSGTGGAVMVLSGLSAASSLTINDSSTAALTDSSAYSDASLAVLTLNNTGSAALTVGNAGITANALTQITITGSGSGTITAGTIHDSGSSALTVKDTSTSTNATSLDLSGVTAATGLTVNQSAAGTLGLGNLSDAGLTSLALNDTGSGALTVGTVTANLLTSLSIAIGTSGSLSLGNLSDDVADNIVINDTSANTNSISLGVASMANAISLTVNDSAKGAFSIGGTISDDHAASLIFNNTGSALLAASGISDNDATVSLIIESVDASSNLVKTGTGGTNVTLSNAGAAAFNLIDSSASTGAAVVTYDAAVTAGPAAITVTDSAIAALTLSSFTDNDLVTASLTNSGAAALTALGVANTTASGTGLFTTLTFGGTGPIALTTLALANDASTVTITDSDTGTATIGTLNIGNVGTPTAGLSINNSNSGSGQLIVSAGVVYANTITLDNSGTGTTSVILTDAAPVVTTIALNDVSTDLGTQSLTLTDTVAAVHLTAGGGNTTLNLHHDGVSGEQITLGNGTNTVSLFDSSLAATATLTFGTGSNVINLQAGHTLGTDTLNFQTALTGSTNISPVTADIIGNFQLDNGTIAGDTIHLSGFTTSASVITAAQANTYTATGVWTSSNGLLVQSGASVINFITDVQQMTQTTAGIAAFLDGRGSTWIAYNDGSHNVAVIELAGIIATGLDLATGTLANGLIHIG